MRSTCKTWRQCTVFIKAEGKEAAGGTEDLSMGCQLLSLLGVLWKSCNFGPGWYRAIVYPCVRRLNQAWALARVSGTASVCFLPRTPSVISPCSSTTSMVGK